MTGYRKQGCEECGHAWVTRAAAQGPCPECGSERTAPWKKPRSASGEVLGCGLFAGLLGFAIYAIKTCAG